MHDFSNLIEADRGGVATPITLVDETHLDAWLKNASEADRNMAKAQRFTGKKHQLLILPGDKADNWRVVAGVADTATLSPWCLAKAAQRLPEGRYRLTDDAQPGLAALGWMLGQHVFDRYKKPEEEPQGPRVLLTSNPANLPARIHEAQATAMVRDLVNTPAEDMGPEHLEEAAENLAAKYKGTIEVVRGDALETGYPMIHGVGRAAARRHAPRLIMLKWGKAEHPPIAVIGKGVCFDSGGLDIKGAAGMLLMKKDMGGAAHALALADLIMGANLPVQLSLYIPAVENAISGGAFRPGDVLTSRSGITVEIGNTDAEGRLVLGDAMTRALEDEPELMIDFATLTGAARIALGADLPAMFANQKATARQIMDAAELASDPVWELPLWDGYAEMLSSKVADINNSGGGFAGSITAALFLKRFALPETDWVHFDTYAWRNGERPGQPVGGEALGLRAAWRFLQHRYG